MMSDQEMVAQDITPATAIETSFPFQRINKLAAVEAYNKHHYRPTNYQHKWWARRLGSVFRMISIAALSNPGISTDELWNRYVDTVNFDDVIVLDPFMGGGTTGQEATRVGAQFVGSDLNPVAWFISRMALEKQTFMLDTHFERVVAQSQEEIQPYYTTQCPDCGNEAGAQFYLWVRLVEYTSLEKDDQLGREYDTLVVDHKRNGGATVVCPNCHLLSEVEEPDQSTCGACGHHFDATEESVRVSIEEPNLVFNGGERPAYEPYAVKYDCQKCNQSGFTNFTGFDIERFEAAVDRYQEVKDELPIPEQGIPEGGEKTRDLHNRNYRQWTHLFNSRQLLALGTLLKNIKQVNEVLARQYLTLTFSATLEFNNMFCSYKGADPRGPGAVRHIFSHHAYVHPGEPLENNPLGTQGRQSGTFRYLYEYRLRKALDYQQNPIERILNDNGTVKEKRSIDGEKIGGDPADSIAELLNGNGSHYLNCGNSANLPFSSQLEGKVDAVITDPPYYDSVQYSELADFFYVWLKQSLEDDFPDIFTADTVVSEEEAVGNRTREKSLIDYQELLQAVFTESYDLLKDDGVLVFTFHHKDPDAWGAVLNAIDGAGYRVVQTYPVRGENRLSVHINNQRAVLLDSIIVCRKDHKKADADWESVYDSIECETRNRVQSFHSEDDNELSKLDASVVARGVCMTMYSAYETVHDGKDDIDEKEAMQRIQPLIEEINNEKF